MQQEDTAAVTAAKPGDITAQMNKALTDGPAVDGPPPPRAAPPAPPRKIRAATQKAASIVLAADTVASQTMAPVALGPAPAVRSLSAVAAPAGAGPSGRSTRAFVTTTKKNDRVILRVSDLKADASPGANFTIFLNLPAGTDPTGAPAEFRVGSVRFFDAVGPGGGMPGMNMPKRAPLEFDITELVREQVASKHWNDDAVVTIIGQGALLANGERIKASAGANAAIGKLEIVHQTP